VDNLWKAGAPCHREVLLRRPRRLPVALAAGLLVAACGGGTTPPPSPTASPTSPSSTPSPTPAAPAAAWLTYHGDAARTGLDLSSPPPDHPRVSWRTASLDGPVWAEPLVDGGRVLVATEGGSIYALDATTGRTIWRTHVADPIPRADLPCGDIDPLGITGTPVIDPATQTLYAVAERPNGTHLLAALSVATGSIAWTKAIDAPRSVPRDQQQRAALALAGGRVLVAFGGLDGDCGTYRGYVVSVPVQGGGGVDTYTLPVINEGGIWAPSGPAVAASGEVYVATGNSTTGSGFDHSNSVIALSPTLTEMAYFAPTDWRALSNADLDLGSTGPLLDGGGALIAGKDGVLFLLNAAHLGGIGGEVASLSLGSGAYGGLALGGSTLLVPTLDRLEAVRVDVAGPSLRVLWRGPATWPPIVAGGAVWAVTHSGTLLALALADGAQLASLPIGPVQHFTTPAAANGWLYVATGNAIVGVRGV
jgi:outer membrane protein assembly factor BamB